VSKPNILLIAGHGAGDPGATGNGYKEADLTRELVKLIQKRLSKFAGVRFLPMERNWYQHICENGAGYDFGGASYVLEVHLNAAKPDTAGDGKNKGAEIYVTTSEDSVAVEENILRRVSSLGFTNRGVKRKNYSLIHYIKRQGVSAALLEACFIDDIDDMRLYQEKKEEYAEAVALGIAEGFGLAEGDAEMEQLKKDIAQIKEDLEGLKNPTVYNYIDNNMPAWARSTVTKLVTRGWLKGDGDGRLNLDENTLRILVINDRAGIYDKE